MVQPLNTGSAAPGVQVNVNTSQVARGAQPQTASSFFAVGYSTWGAVNTPTVVTSFQEYVRRFGSFNANSFLTDAMYIFFNLFGGNRAVVCRVVGDDAAVATVTIQDRGVGIAQHATLKIDAKNPSSSVDVRYAIEAGTTANTFKLRLRSAALGIREVFDDLKMDAASITLVNQQSVLVNLTNLASANAAPTNLPTLTDEATLAGGSDDFAGLAAADYIGVDDGSVRTGLQAFKSEEWGTGQVAIPGLTTSAVHAAIIAHAESFKRAGLLDPPLASDKDDVVAIRALYGTNQAAVTWPWVEMMNFAGTGLRKFYPPAAFVAGACAKAEREVGVHKAPANYVIPGALDVERAANDYPQTDEGTRAYLAERDVNVIARLPEQGVKIYDEQVMTGDNRVKTLHEIRTLNYLYYQLKRAYQSIPFAVIDSSGRLFREAKSLSETYLRQLYRAGALFGNTEEEAFIVICDSSNNPPEEIDQGRLNVTVGVRLSMAARFVFVDIENVPLTSSLSLLQQ
jgi:phage tail sheath protein FI